MDSNYVLAGTIISGVLILAGVIWQTRARPEPLSNVVKTQQSEIDRLNGRIANMQIQIDDLNQRLGTVTRLENEKSRLIGGVTWLSAQIVAMGGVPAWTVPDDIIGTNAKDATGSHPAVNGGN